MTNVSDVTVQSAIQGQQQTAAASEGLAENFQQFLTLLTVQLQNQDPLSPMDSTEFTNQLVAFTQVEQQVNTNQKMDNLIALGLSNSMSSAQSYVGKDVNYISSEFHFDGSPREMRFSLPQEASLAVMHIYDAEGTLLYEEPVTTKPGAHDIVWNGTTKSGAVASEGTYQIKINALDNDGKPIETTTVVSGKVAGVESQGGDIFLLVGERAVGLGNVLSTNDTAINHNAEAVTSALNYIGLDVGFESNQFSIDSGGEATLSYSLPRDVDRAKIQIYNDRGDLVHTADAETTAGSHDFTWDASNFAAGKYSFRIHALAKPEETVSTRTITLSDDEPSKMNYTLAKNYSDVKVEIFDSNNNLVFNEKIDNNLEGAYTYEWDGKLNDGTTTSGGRYRVTFTGYGQDDVTVNATSQSKGRVTGVETDNGIIFLEIDGKNRIPLRDIDTISNPRNAEVPANNDGSTDNGSDGDNDTTEA